MQYYRCLSIVKERDKENIYYIRTLSLIIYIVIILLYLMLLLMHTFVQVFVIFMIFLK